MSGRARFDRRRFLKTSGVAGAAVVTGGLATGAPGRSPGAKEDEVLVGVSAGKGDVAKTVNQYVPGDATVVHTNDALRYAAVKFPTEAGETARQQFIDAVTRKEGIKYAERNATHETQLTPNDPLFGDQYAPQQVDAPAAWDVTLGCSGVTVAIIDTGAQYDHPDLQGNFKSNPGKDFVDADPDPYPDAPADEFHATHVSGLACGGTDNGTGIAGIGDCSLINGRALDESGSGSTADIADAIVWATDQGADIINLSLGGGGYTSTMKSAVQYASNNDALPICAAGNAGSSSVSYPAAYSECVAVSAVDSSENLAAFSQYGSSVELCAPGVDILSTTTQGRGGYERLSGTSMATPIVSGVACLALCKWPGLTNSQLRGHLKNTAENIGLAPDEQGAGQVNAYNAVTNSPSCGSNSTSTVLSDELFGSSDSDCWMRQWEYANPCQVTVELTGPSSADFDLYVNEGSGTCPTTSSYDYRGYTANSEETISITNPDDSAPLYVTVDSYSGSGNYDLTITEYQ